MLARTTRQAPPTLAHFTRRRTLASLSSSTPSSSSPPPSSSTSTSTSNSSSPPSLTNVPNTIGRIRNERRRGMIFIRAWDGFSSMPEGLAVIRGVERKFGKLRDFQLIRDFDNPLAYQPFAYAQLTNPENIHDIPKEGLSLQIKVPIIPRLKPGGPGLEDFKGLLDSADKVSGKDEGEHENDTYLTVLERMRLEEERTVNAGKGSGLDGKEGEDWRTIDVKVERTARTLYYPISEEYPSVYRNRIIAIGQAFTKWNGFFVPQPDAALASPPIRGDKTFRNTNITLIRMEQSKNAWKAMFGRLGVSKKLRGENGEVEKTSSSSAEDTTELGETTEDASSSPAEGVDVVLLERTGVEEGGPEKLEAKVIDSPSSTASSPSSSPLETLEPEPASTASGHQHYTAPKPTVTRKQRLLLLARETAKTPLPASVREPTEEEQKVKEEELAKEMREKEAQRVSVRDRLLKLMGGKWA